MTSDPADNRRIPLWANVLGGAVIVGGAVVASKWGTMEGGKLAGYAFLPTLMGAGIGFVAGKIRLRKKDYERIERRRQAARRGGRG